MFSSTIIIPLLIMLFVSFLLILPFRKAGSSLILGLILICSSFAFTYFLVTSKDTSLLGYNWIGYIGILWITWGIFVCINSIKELFA